MPGHDSERLVRCMHGNAGDFNAAGGTALVHWLPNVWDEDGKQLRSLAESFLAGHAPLTHTTVFVAGSAGRYQAESYSLAGRPIQFCGHGSLAAAWVVFSECEPDETELEFANRLHTWQARQSTDESAGIVLAYKRPLLTECAVPDFAVACIGVQALAASEAGADDGYLILELADANEVRRLEPDYAAIEAATRRAVIVTASSIVAGEPECVYRYFAPQYGTPEDAATGSAAVQLAAYWAPRLQREQFRALQLSPGGALLRLACKGETVELAARVGYG